MTRAPDAFLVNPAVAGTTLMAFMALARANPRALAAATGMKDEQADTAR